ncbi:MAG: hypothetical protein J5545_07830 [Bacteroidaceae bacterium]|nr:hypothetical protein [Bacteroidaceae bacterium]
MDDNAFNLVQQSVLEHSMTDDERLLERLRITRDKELPEMDFLFRIFGKPCFPRGELVAVTGKAKSGKTLFASMMLAGSLSPDGLSPGGLSPDPSPIGEGSSGSASRVKGGFYSVLYLQRIRDEPLRVLWYDTEQSEQSTQDILRNRILRLVAGGEASSFDVFNVRSLHFDERLRLFEVAVRRFHPDFVLLDGVRDLLADINDGVKAQAVVERLMQLAQETGCCLTCVLHQNKGVEDRNLRGWIGTELMNKAFEVYACEKVKPENIFVVEQTHTRKYDLEELLFFRMDPETELPVACEAPTRYVITNGIPQLASQLQPGEKLPHMNREWLTFDEHNKPHPKAEELFYEALKAGPLNYIEMQTRVQTLLNCGAQMWNNMFCRMRDAGFIVRLINSKGKSIWQLSSKQSVSEAPTETEPDLFDQIAADLGESPTPWPPL